jgi:hypothetical protein
MSLKYDDAKNILGGIKNWIKRQFKNVIRVKNANNNFEGVRVRLKKQLFLKIE